MPIPKNFIFRGDPLPPLEEKSIGQFYHRLLKEHGDKVALVDAETHEKITYCEILEKSQHLAAYLQKIGIRHGDMVAICSENSLLYPLPILAAHYIGAICAPVNSSYTVRELEHALNLSKPKIVFCSEFTEDLVNETVGKLKYVQEVIVLGQSSQFPQQHKCLSDVLNEAVGSTFTMHDVKDPKDEVAFIFCSSGTTGLPKGVMITHANFLSLISIHDQPSIARQDQSLDTTVGFLPMFHAYGIAVLLMVLRQGKRLVVMSQFNPETFLRLIQDYKVEGIPVVPPIVAFLAKHPMIDEYDLTSLKRLGVGAAPISRELLNDLFTRMPWIEDIRQGYGLTEFTLSGIMNIQEGKAKLGSVGQTAPGIETKVIDPKTGKSLGPGKSGEICFRGPLLMKGYINNPKATAETIDSEGWLHTGDVGYYDEDGYFYIIDRLKELIKYKGFQVPPAELEAVLMSHPAVMDAAVIGVPDRKSGEVPRGFVVKKAPITEKELLKFVEKQVSSPKRLRGGIRFLDSIPKNQSGKILRRELRELSKSKL